MNAYDFVQLGLYAIGSEIKGKTKLQKTIYFLGELTDCGDELGYYAHYYGPYSSEVAEAADRLRSIGFLEQAISTGGAYDSRGFEVARWDFTLNEEGKKVADLKKEQSMELWKKLQNAAEKLEGAGDLDYQKLSIAAKTYFLLRERGDQASIKEIKKLAEKCSWPVSEVEIEEAAKFLQKIGLVELMSSD